MNWTMEGLLEAADKCEAVGTLSADVALGLARALRNSNAQVKALKTVLDHESISYTIPLRPNLNVVIKGVPRDLTEAESKRIQAVVNLLVIPAEEPRGFEEELRQQYVVERDLREAAYLRVANLEEALRTAASALDNKEAYICAASARAIADAR